MICYTVGVVGCTLGAVWLIEDWVNMGWNNFYLIYIACILLGFVLISFKLRKSG